MPPKDRVHIVYEVDEGDSQRQINIPFLMGVMADLSGNAGEKESVEERNFTSVDAQGLDGFMKRTAPKVSMRVPNTLTGEGEIPIELSFNSMSDFTPEAIAERVEGLSDLFKTRKLLSDLLARLDGKPKAEEALAKILEDPDYMKTLADSIKAEERAPQD